MTTSSLVSAVGHDVPISKKDYVELLRYLNREVHSSQSECEARTYNLLHLHSKVENVLLNVPLLAGKAGSVGRLQKQLSTVVCELDSLKQVLEAKEDALKE